MRVAALGTCRRMALRARSAAVCFARRGVEKGERRRAWMSATMRWRQRRTTAPPPPRGWQRGAAASTTIWVPSFHCHFGALAGDRVERPMPAASRPGVRTHRPRTIVVHRQFETVRLGAAPTPFRREQRVSRVFAIARSAAGKAHAVGVTPARSSSAVPAHELPSRGASRQHAMPLARPAAIARRTFAREPERQPTRPDRRSHAREVPLAHRHPATPGADAPHRHRGASPAPPRLDRAPELVWRRAAPTAKLHVGDGAGFESAAPHSTSRPAARSLPPRETLPAPVAPASRPAPQQLTQLDPALVDRLADDVIRRIEKRARIERDRRGL